MPISLLGLRHLEETISIRYILKHRLYLCGIGSVKLKKRNLLTLFVSCLSMIDMSHC